MLGAYTPQDDGIIWVSDSIPIVHKKGSTQGYICENVPLCSYIIKILQQYEITKMHIIT